MLKISNLLSQSQGKWQCVIDNAIHQFNIDLVDYNEAIRIHLIYSTYDKDSPKNINLIIDQICTYHYETSSDETGCIIETEKGNFMLDGANENNLLLYMSIGRNDRSEATFRCKRQILE